MSCHSSHITKTLHWLGFEPQTWNLECDVELEVLRYAELQHTLDSKSSHAVEEKRETVLWLPVASHSVPMGAH